MIHRICIALFCLPACSDYALDPTKGTEGLEAQLVADPPNLDFGLLPFGASATAPFVLRAAGDRTVTLGELRVDGDGAFTLAGPAPGTRLAPGDEAEVLVTWSPSGLHDDAQAQVASDADDPLLRVPLAGAAESPAITVAPSPVSLTSLAGEAVSMEVIATSAGTSPLEISAALLIGEPFAIDHGLPVTLEPGETTSFTVTFTPPNFGTFEGQLWLSTNAPGETLVPLEGTLQPPCFGLAEAWDRGALSIEMNSSMDILLSNTDPEATICVDTWYFYLSSETQDAGGGDPAYDPGAAYPDGSLEIAGGETLHLRYSETSAPAWWCVEETQVTAPTTLYEFIGARVPAMLLRSMLDGDQEAVWATLREDPVIAVGHGTHYLELAAGEAASMQVVAENLGRQPGAATITETLPPGFVGDDFSVAPWRTEVGSGGETTYSFDLSFAAAVDTPIDTQTIYDQQVISYTLTRTDSACLGRQTSQPPTALWTDSAGDTQTGDGAPLVILCR